MIRPMNRSADWMSQAERDLAHARHSVESSDFEWAAFAAQQAAEKAVKALILARSGEPWGHSVSLLLESLFVQLPEAETLREAANRLDKHYIPARYPNGFPAGYPGKLYTSGEAEAAIVDATELVSFCRRHLAR